MTPGADATRPLPMPADGNHGPRDGEGQSLHDDIAWLVRLRWLAVAGVLAALWTARLVDWEPSVVQPLLVAAVLAAVNLLAHWRNERSSGASPQAQQRQVLAQLLVDLVALAFLIEWTGGIVNPFVMFFVFPVAIGAITLTTRSALVLGGSAFLLFAGLVVCAIYSQGTHQPFGGERGQAPRLLNHPAYFTGLLSAAAATLFGIVYFLRTVVARHTLAEENRREAARIAQSRERMARVGMIAAGVAHSVRNPLHGVLNCIDLVRSSESLEEAGPTLALMEEGLSRIEKVTSRLLTLSREAPLTSQAVDLDELVDDTVRLLEVRAQRQGVELRRDLGGCHRVDLDPIRIQEALFNILDNAIAAVADLPVRWVAVRTTAVDQPFDGVALEVEDPGVGVDPADLARVFDPFFSTKPVGEGTGLGLAIAKQVVEAHGGVIQFTSQRNTGTKVRILLPSRAPAALVGGSS